MHRVRLQYSRSHELCQELNSYFTATAHKVHEQNVYKERTIDALEHRNRATRSAICSHKKAPPKRGIFECYPSMNTSSQSTQRIFPVQSFVALIVRPHDGHTYFRELLFALEFVTGFPVSSSVPLTLGVPSA